MRRMLSLIGAGGGRDHRAVFHTFAEGLARVIRPTRTTARVRAVEG
ncbi:hypothetical protein [Bauldia litoralis]|uniref:Uncharacterized protein n=1 Tax=Bauldia litoralis TaxID=665467 RepID=A0A1G6CF65_9HYPH|nr:hypothetical protein [Bauldia litoralis]SDB31503.1 hypothetical protein SAMN02982931_02412 [Bauldia litoralis]